MYNTYDLPPYCENSVQKGFKVVDRDRRLI